MLDQFRNNTIHRIDRNRKPNTGIGAARTHNLRIDPNQSTGTVKQGASGVTWINCSISLNHPFYRSIGH